MSQVRAVRTAAALLESARPAHWLKNLLVFLPLLGAHRLDDAQRDLRAALAFVAFSLCAGAVYLFNDLRDSDVDRRNPLKMGRPIASGRLGRPIAAAFVPVLLGAAIAVGVSLGTAFIAALCAYFITTVAYSLGIKRVPVLDILTLAGGFALRVVAGALAVNLALSGWLIAFCGFLFFSLALLKRYAELVVAYLGSGKETPDGHGYTYRDGIILVAQGVGSGFLALLVLALYTNSRLMLPSSAGQPLFWLICLLLLAWMNYLWLMGHRGRIHEDPVAFALRDRVSLPLMLAMGLCAVLT